MQGLGQCIEELAGTALREIDIPNINVQSTRMAFLNPVDAVAVKDFSVDFYPPRISRQGKSLWLSCAADIMEYENNFANVLLSGLKEKT